jgi:hypothetical protein
VLTENQKSDEPLERQIESLSGKMVEVRKEISKAIVGQEEVVKVSSSRCWLERTSCWKGSRVSVRPCWCARWLKLFH